MSSTSKKLSNDGITQLKHGISGVPDVAINATSNNTVNLLSEKTTKTYLLDTKKTNMVIKSIVL